MLGFNMQGWGQNLVPNPSFEDTSYCVTGSGEMPAALGWNSYGDSPDYFNVCSSNADVSVPNNWGGYQEPSSGNAYAALGTFCTDCGIGPNVREFIGRNLSTPLNIGTKYYVSFKAVLSTSPTIWANCATNNLGVGFTNIPYNWSTSPFQINNNPKVFCDSIIKDTLNWVTVFGSFIADSSYQYIVLGNLFDDPSTDTLIVDSGASPTGNCTSYYYIDDICVSTDSSYTANYLYTGIVNSPLAAVFSLYPNPLINQLNIESNSNTPYEIIIHNAIGQIVYQEFNINANHKMIDLSTYSKGMLLVSIKSNNQTICHKLLKH